MPSLLATRLCAMIVFSVCCVTYCVCFRVLWYPLYVLLSAVLPSACTIVCALVSGLAEKGAVFADSRCMQIWAEPHSGCWPKCAVQALCAVLTRVPGGSVCVRVTLGSRLTVSAGCWDLAGTPVGSVNRGGLCAPSPVTSSSL